MQCDRDFPDDGESGVVAFGSGAISCVCGGIGEAGGSGDGGGGCDGGVDCGGGAEDVFIADGERIESSE